MPRKRNTDPGVYRYTLQSGATRWGAILYASPDWETGRRRQKRKQGFATKAEAAAWRVAQLNERHRGTDQIEPSKQPLGAYLDDWLASLTDLAPSTRRIYRYAIGPLKDRLGHIPLSQITPAMCEDANAALLRSGMSAIGVRYAHLTLSRALRRAERLDLISRNPCTRVTPPRKPPHEPETWTPEQMGQFLAVNRNHPVWGDLWLVLTETWMRIGEAAALTWADVDWAAGLIRITHTVSKDDAGQLVSGPTKTPKSRRVIHISPVLLEALRRRRDLAVSPEAGALIFPGPQSGTYLEASSARRALIAGCQAAGVPELSPHDLRHTGASLAYMDRIDDLSISARLGHQTTTFTKSAYIHLNEAHQRSVAERIAGSLAGQYDSVITNDTDEE